MIVLIVLWVIVTLLVVTLASIFAKKYGVEYLIGTVGVLIVLANIFAAKIVTIGSIPVTAAIIVFSATFLATDILSEKWGKAAARRAVWFGFFANLILVVTVLIAINWPSASFATEMGENFNQVLGLTPRIVFASLLAYLASQHHDVWAFHFWKRLTKGKHLWLRNNASTAVSQLIDSAIFGVVAFYGVIPIVPLILGQWVIKVAIAILDTPFMYWVSSLLGKVK